MILDENVQAYLGMNMMTDDRIKAIGLYLFTFLNIDGIKSMPNKLLALTVYNVPMNVQTDNKKI